MIWQNHGLWTVGESVESAAWRFIIADDTARAHLLAHAAGAPVIPVLDHPPAESNKARHEFFGWLNFLPLWDRIRVEEPDLLD